MQIISNLEWKSFYEFETSFSLPRSVNYFPIPVFLFFFSCQIFDTFFSFFYLFRVTHFSLFVHLCFPAIPFFFFTVRDHLLKQQYRYRLIYVSVYLHIFGETLHARVASSIYRDPAFRICHVHGFHPGKADRGEEKRLNPGLNLNNLSVAGRLTRDCRWKNFLRKFLYRSFSPFFPPFFSEPPSSKF